MKNEFNEFEFVSDEELWEEIYGVNTKPLDWRGSDLIQDMVF
jgi:hypothetical protein